MRMATQGSRLNVWSLVNELFWEGLRDVALLEEVSYSGGGL